MKFQKIKKFIKLKIHHFVFLKMIDGEVAEWLKAHAWKACKGAILSWVRIPFSPPLNYLSISTIIEGFYHHIIEINQQFFLKNVIFIFFQNLKNDK